ncbi:MAG: omptin family outer membrane protease [Treponema sp.]|nr:omptin family outer membrane protease [Treponema sp.]
MFHLSFNRKLLVLIVIFTLSLSSEIFTLSLSSENSDNFNLTIDTGIGFLNGKISEYVYDKDCLNTDNVLSRLDWDINCVPYLEAEVFGNLYKYLHFSAAGKVAIPVESGFMQDYDWLNSLGGPNGYYPLWKNDDPTEITNYSKHTNIIEKYYNFSILLGGNIYIPNTSIVISPFAAYEYWFISFNAKDGYRKYKSENWVQKNFSGSVISYKQEYNSALFGLETSAQLTENLMIKGTFAISPLLCFNNSLDNHIATSSYYLDIIKNAMEYKAKVKLLYKTNEHTAIGFSTGIQLIPETRGYDYNPIFYNGKMYVDLDNPARVLGGIYSFICDFTFTVAILL